MLYHGVSPHAAPFGEAEIATGVFAPRRGLVCIGGGSARPMPLWLFLNLCLPVGQEEY